MSEADKREEAIISTITWLGALGLVAGVVAGVLSPLGKLKERPLLQAVLLGAAMVCAWWALRGASTQAAVAWAAARRRKSRTVGTVRGRSSDHQPSDYTYVSQRVLHVVFWLGRQRHEVKWSPQYFYSNNSWLMERVDRKYPDGTELVVHYEREDPENAAVGRAIAAPLVTIPLVAAFMALVAGTMFMVASAFTLEFAGAELPESSSQVAD
ncbi:MAG: hypothetical protein GX537_04960 [Actinobacteria bacterium]|nr:hypothetical protein [Actinomycetota bacterium]